MKKYLVACFLAVIFSCKNQKKNESINSEKDTTQNVIDVKDSLIFNKEGKVVDISHFENDILKLQNL